VVTEVVVLVVLVDGELLTILVSEILPMSLNHCS
jgi:hypothetical protein